MADLRGIARLGRALARGELPLRELRAQLGRQRIEVPGVAPSLAMQALRFGAVGVLSTVAYLLLFLLTRHSLGAQLANFMALLITAIANTAVNRRFTFGVQGTGAAKHQLQGLVVFGLGLALTSGALGGLSILAPHAGRVLEVSVLIAANLAATVLRFVLMREWVFAEKRAAARPTLENAR
jgi:putative flippase GtrA